MNVLKKTLIEYQEKTLALIIKKTNYRFYQIPPQSWINDKTKSSIEYPNNSLLCRNIDLLV